MNRIRFGPTHREGRRLREPIPGPPRHHDLPGQAAHLSWTPNHRMPGQPAAELPDESGAAIRTSVRMDYTGTRALAPGHWRGGSELAVFRFHVDEGNTHAG